MIHITKRVELSLAAFGLMILLLIFIWPESESLAPYGSYLQYMAGVLKGSGESFDLTQDVIGFRAMVRQENAYPILGTAVQELGLNWTVGKHASTHPPTAFLFVAPIAFLPWPVASMIWAWLMLGALALSFRVYGLPWLAALGLTPIVVLWPPMALSLGQFTIVWLLGFAIGYRYMRRNYFLSGLGIGLAALTKILPGLMIILFLSKKRWSAIMGFVLTIFISVAGVVLLSPEAISQYIEVNRLNSIVVILRSDNAALLGLGYRSNGWLGIVPVRIFLALILWVNRGRVFSKAAVVPTTDQWVVLTYFSVMFLPVFWIYSLVPLLPVIIFLLSRKKKKMPTLFVGTCCIIIPFITPAWYDNSVLPLVLVNVLLGLGLIFDVLPYRLFWARSVEMLFARSSQ